MKLRSKKSSQKSITDNASSITKIHILYIGIYPTPLPQTRCNTKSIFKWNTIGLNSVFLSSTSSCTKVKEHSLPYYLPIAEVRNS